MYKILKYDRSSSVQDFFYQMVVFVLNTRQFCHRVRFDLNVPWRFCVCEGYVDIKYEVLRYRYECVCFLTKLA
jgi:hypothetical protein